MLFLAIRDWLETLEWGHCLWLVYYKLIRYGKLKKSGKDWVTIKPNIGKKSDILTSD